MTQSFPPSNCSFIEERSVKNAIRHSVRLMGGKAMLRGGVRG